MPEPVHVHGRLPARRTVAGVHVEQLVVWHVTVTSVVLLRDAPTPVLVGACVVAAVVLGLTATRWGGMWTYRHLLHRIRLRRHVRRVASGDRPPIGIRDARLGRRRRLATVHDGTGWSAVARLVPSDGVGGAFPLGPVMRVVESFLAEAEHDFAEVQVVHTLLPPGRTARVRTVVGAEERDLPPVVASTWIACRAHGVEGNHPDRPVPDLQEIRRDLRRAVDGVVAGLGEAGIGATALTTRRLYADCVLAAGGRASGPEPEVMPDAARSATVERRPVPATPRTGRGADERPAECESVEIASAAELGDGVHVVHAVRAWPEAGFGTWLDALGCLPAGVVTVVVTLARGRAADGPVASVLVRHTTGGEEDSAFMDSELLDLADEFGVGLRRLAVPADDALLATLPLGARAAQAPLGTLPGFAVAAPEHPVVVTRGTGVGIGTDTSGSAVLLPLLGAEPSWTAVIGEPELAAVLAAATLAADVPVHVVSPWAERWEELFARFAGAERLEVRASQTEGATAPSPAAPIVRVVDDYGPQSLRPVLRPWQGGICRIDPDITDLRGLLSGVTHVVTVRCTAEQAAELQGPLGLSSRDADRLTTVPDGFVALAGPGGVEIVELDPELVDGLGVQEALAGPPAREAPPSSLFGGRPMMAG